jgi:hypothetical protein
MSKPPSDATLLRNARSELARVKRECDDMQTNMEKYRARAIKAEQECAEWKVRFDALLQRDVFTQPRATSAAEPWIPPPIIT